MHILETPTWTLQTLWGAWGIAGILDFTDYRHMDSLSTLVRTGLKGAMRGGSCRAGCWHSWTRGARAAWSPQVGSVWPPLVGPHSLSCLEIIRCQHLCVGSTQKKCTTSSPQLRRPAEEGHTPMWQQGPELRGLLAKTPSTAMCPDFSLPCWALNFPVRLSFGSLPTQLGSPLLPGSLPVPLMMACDCLVTGIPHQTATPGRDTCLLAL